MRWDTGITARLAAVVVTIGALGVAAGARVAEGQDQAAPAAAVTAQDLRLQLARERRHHARERARLTRALRADGDVSSAIRVASIVYHVPERQLRAVAFCESRLDPRAKNPKSPASGLMQFYPSTYAGTPFRSVSLWNPYASALAAAWLVRQDGGWRQWACRP